MTMLGRYCIEENPAISTAGYIDALDRIGVSAHATRLTVSRMTERGLLERLREGRAAYFRATDVALRVVRVQDQRTFHGAGESANPEGAWTILCFSLPESHRKERHLLRRRLAWEGFGLLRDGVWIAPGEHDLGDILEQLSQAGVDQNVEAFTAYPKLGDVHGMISRTWELEELSERYESFLRDWDVPAPAPQAADALGRDLLLISTWRQLLRETPRLPDAHLPDGWPAARCLDLFRTLHAEYHPEADRLFAGILEENRLRS
ncbi:PaaX family transcriptional regulator C-terminal domain-containing protein [Amycolatopsis sp.]|uniref:PaaX family transcriptional regulator n=1 Tax=Amycolatopsis sp. TaxID=37632 RepID=UPI002DF95454|nr:PaaX family transcriptional regulator C-terminal domain-containing protein [Amycolatopsis sp.]